MSYSVALCGLSPKDRHLVEIVITRVPNPKHAFRVVPQGSTDDVDIAIVDTDNPLGEAQLAELRLRRSHVIGIFLSDHGLLGGSRYRIERRSLLLRVLRTLEEVVDLELSSNKVRQHPTAERAPAAPVATSPATHSDSAFASGDMAPDAGPSEIKPLRGLIVDDSLTVREQLKGALERAGIVSDAAENAEQAMALIQRNTYDIAFLDVVMSGIDGYELCRKIKQNIYTRGLPVLMLTSRSSPFDRARGALAGCDAYLVKPITWEGFYQAVDKTLTRCFKNDRVVLASRGYRISQGH